MNMNISVPLFDEVTEESLVGEDYDFSAFKDTIEEGRKSYLSKVMSKVFEEERDYE